MPSRLEVLAYNCAMRQQRTAQRAGLGGVIICMEILWLGSVSNPLIPTIAIISNESNEASGDRDKGTISVTSIIGSNVIATAELKS
jgi:hypothetical protein